MHQAIPRAQEVQDLIIKDMMVKPCPRMQLPGLPSCGFANALGSMHHAASVLALSVRKHMRRRARHNRRPEPELPSGQSQRRGKL